MTGISLTRLDPGKEPIMKESSPVPGHQRSRSKFTDLIGYGTASLVATLAWMQADSFSVTVGGNLNPDTLPRGLAILIAGCAVLGVLREFIPRRSRGMQGLGGPADDERVALPIVLVFIAGCVVFLYLFRNVGYLGPTVLFVGGCALASALLRGRRRGAVVELGIAAAVVASMGALFTYVLGVPLPGL